MSTSDVSNQVSLSARTISSGELNRSDTNNKDHMVSMRVKNRRVVTKRDGSEHYISYDKIRNHLYSNADAMLPEPLSEDLMLDNVYRLVINRSDAENITTREIDNICQSICHDMVSEHPDYDRLALRLLVCALHKDIGRHTVGGVESTKHERLTFSQCCDILTNTIRHDTNRPACILNPKMNAFIQRHADLLDDIPIYDRDYDFTFFGLHQLKKKYLLSLGGCIYESPQDMYLRVAVSFWYQSIDPSQYDSDEAFLEAERTLINTVISEHYKMQSLQLYTHATPTLMKAGTNFEQLASCFLLDVGDDSRSILQTVQDVGLISRSAGGIGLDFSRLRMAGSRIDSSDSISSGAVTYAPLFSATLRGFNQSGKRKGNATIYMMDWHPDILYWLDLRRSAKKLADSTESVQSIFTALMMSDLFFKRLSSGSSWSLFDPKKCADLVELYGDEYVARYEYYEANGFAEYTFDDAAELWKNIIDCQITTGSPFMLSKDNINAVSNQSNIGTVVMSNLCTEIVEVTKPAKFRPMPHEVEKTTNISEDSLRRQMQSDYVERAYVPKEMEKTGDSTESSSSESSSHSNSNYGLDGFEWSNTSSAEDFYAKSDSPPVHAVCTLASVNLTKHVIYDDNGNASFDYEKLIDTVRFITKVLDRSIDIMKYPVPGTEFHRYSRPLGIGVQGLANTFNKLGLVFGERDSRIVNKQIFETMYWAALHESMDLAKQFGPYHFFEGSPLSEGRFQFDMYSNDPGKRIYTNGKTVFANDLYDQMSSEDDQVSPQQFNCSPMLDYDWSGFREEIMKTGTRNSLLLAPMPTASTSQILGNNECIEPFTRHVYTRAVDTSNYTVMNLDLVNALMKENLWNAKVVAALIRGDNLDAIPNVPEYISKLYVTAYQIKQKKIIDLAADRQRFVCQSQSMNLYFDKQVEKRIAMSLVYGHNRGLKTLCYYIHTVAATSGIEYREKSTDLDSLVMKGLGRSKPECSDCEG